MIKQNKLTKKDYELIGKIVDRAKNENVLLSDTLILFIDLEYIHETIGLRLKDLLDAGRFDFRHDLFGIQQNFNRQTKQLENCFLPRFVVHEVANND